MIASKEKMEPIEDALDKKICEMQIQIKNADGLHMRPAMQFVDVANQFDCEYQR